MRANTLTNRVTISRLGAIEGSHKTGRTELATGVKCLILPSDYRAAAARGMELNQAYDGYFLETQDLEVGDKITDTVNNKTYKVNGIQINPGIHTAHKRVELALNVGS